MKQREAGAWPNDEEVGDSGSDFKTLTKEEAEALRARVRLVSPWQVVLLQAAAGVVVVALAWLLSGRQEVVWSALYGSASVVLPNALMARGMGRNRASGVKAGAAAFNFMFWEFAKIALTVAMLAAAVKVVPELSWPALLGALVVCMKVNWLALLWRGQKTGIRS